MRQDPASQHQPRVSTDLTLVSTGRGMLQAWGVTEVKSLEKSLSRGQQPLLFCRQCWGFLAAEDHLSLPALFHGPSQRGAQSRTALGSFSHTGSVLLKMVFSRFVSPVLSHKTQQLKHAFYSSLPLAMRVQNTLASLLSHPVLCPWRAGFKSSF